MATRKSAKRVPSPGYESPQVHGPKGPQDRSAGAGEEGR